MALDGKLLRRAKEELNEIRIENELKYSRRRADVYKKLPQVRELDALLRASVLEVIGSALSREKDPAAAVEAIGRDNLTLQARRAELLVGAGFPADYLDERPVCPDCGDTGYIGIKMCDCLRELYREEQRKDLSSLLKLGEETFDAFDIEWYDDTPDPVTGISPRMGMDIVYETCLQYARKFGKKSTNLFLSGGTGLGKTFLSACVAKVVFEKGFSVVYDTASALFSMLEAEKFSKSEDTEGIKSEVRRYMDCDLLIIDDLGTELTTTFVVSALYTLVNTRLITGKKTIINSNLGISDIAGRYSPQIASRMKGEYQVLNFYGKDIRILKKEL